MKVRGGFISNSSSASFIIRMDGLEGKQMTVEDVKRFFPPSDKAKKVLSMNDLEDIYIAVWTLLTAHEDDGDFYGFESSSYPEYRWKKGRRVRCGQDSDAEYYHLLNNKVSQNLYSYNESLFDTGNIRFSNEF